MYNTIAINRSLNTFSAFSTDEELFWFMHDHENELDNYVFSTLSGKMDDETEMFLTWYEDEKGKRVL